MKRLLLLTVMLSLSAIALAADPPVAKIKCGPWVMNVEQTEMTIVWTTTERCMGWVEIAPDDGTSFYTVERPRYDEDFMGRHVVSKVHHVRITGLEPGTTTATIELHDENSQIIKKQTIAITVRKVGDNGWM